MTNILIFLWTEELWTHTCLRQGATWKGRTQSAVSPWETPKTASIPQELCEGWYRLLPQPLWTLWLPQSWMSTSELCGSCEDAGLPFKYLQPHGQESQLPETSPSSCNIPCSAKVHSLATLLCTTAAQSLMHDTKEAKVSESGLVAYISNWPFHSLTMSLRKFYQLFEVCFPHL